MESIPDPIVVADQDERIVFCNAAFAGLCGRPREALLGGDLVNALPSELGAEFGSRLARAWEDGTSCTFAVQCGTPATWLEVRIHPAPTALTAHFQDITARKSTEERLADSERRARAHFQAVPVPTYTWERVDDRSDLLLTDFNEAARLATEGKIATVLGGRATDLYQSQPDILRQLHQCLDQQRVTTHEARYQMITTAAERLVAITYVPITASRVMVHVEEVTERRRAEEALRESEREYRQIVETVNEGISRCDHAGIITFVNQRMAEMLGYEPGDLLGRSVLELVAGEYHPTARRAFRRTIRGATDRIELPLCRRDGSRLWALVSTSPILNDAGEFVGALGTFTDVSDRRQTQETLREREARLRAIIEAAAIGIAYGALDGRLLGANPALQRMLGYSEGELIGREAREFFHPDDVGQTVPLYLDLLERRRSHYQVVVRLIRRDGSFRWVILTGALVRNDQDEPLYSLGTVEDITELKQAQEALRHEERRYHSLVAATAQVVWITNPSGHLVNDQPAWRTLTGQSCEEILGHGWQEAFHPEDQPDARRAWDEAVSLGSVYNGQCRLRCAGGEYRPFWFRGVPVRGDSGDIIEWIGAGGDLSEHVRLEEQLRQAQKMEAVGRLAGGVAHDFNNMLAVINGYSELLLSFGDLDSTARGPLAEIQKAGARAAELTGQLLAFSRKSIITLQSVDLNDVVSGMERMLGRLIGEDIDLRVTLEPELGRVRADPSQLDQVVLNLAVNARDAMPTGGQLTIETKRALFEGETTNAPPGLTAGEYALLTVTDTGSGIDPSTLRHIWEPFFSTKGDRGTGLGLATVYGIIQQNGGEVEVESALGKGTTFRLFFPCAGPLPDSAASIAERSQPFDGSATVLLVEDEDMVRALVRNVLLTDGYRVLEARNGTDALTLVEHSSGPIHLLLTDVVMPGGVSAGQLAGTLQRSHPDVRVLYMSGYTDDAVMRHGVREAETSFIQKPFSPEALLRRLREILA